MSDIEVSVVIPALNEAPAIGSLVQDVQEALKGHTRQFEVIVVDDGSSDGTAAAARAAGARVLGHPINRGYGQALRTGLEGAKYDWVVTIDGDRSYPPSQIVRLLEYAPSFDLVIGARTGAYFWGNPGQALLRWIYLKIASFVVGAKLPDANSGLRLVRRPLALNHGPVECLGYSFSTTMTLSFLQSGRFVKFVPIEFHARVGSSKVRMVRDILRTLQLMMQILIVFNPLKLFVTLAAIPALAAAGFLAAYCASARGEFLIAGAVALLVSVLCFLTGCLLDSMRMLLRRLEKR